MHNITISGKIQNHIGIFKLVEIPPKNPGIRKPSYMVLRKNEVLTISEDVFFVQHYFYQACRLHEKYQLQFNFNHPTCLLTPNIGNRGLDNSRPFSEVSS